MEEDALDSTIYAINKETGEEFAVGGVVEMPRLAPGGVLKDTNEPIILTGGSCECVVSLKTITKKRFIKLLMARGYQRNDAIKLHEKYMNEHGSVRSRLGLEIFIIKQHIERKVENG